MESPPPSPVSSLSSRTSDDSSALSTRRGRVAQPLGVVNASELDPPTENDETAVGRLLRAWMDDSRGRGGDLSRVTTSLTGVAVALNEAALRESGGMETGNPLVPVPLEVRPLRVETSDGPAGPLRHHRRGFRARIGGDVKAAVREYSAALAANPRDFRSLVNRGFAYDKLRKHRLALRDYTAAAAIAPRDAFAHYNVGVSHVRLEQWGEAVKAFTHAINLHPKEFSFYIARGWAYRQLDLFLESTRDYILARKVAPEGAIKSSDELELRALDVAADVFKDMTKKKPASPETRGEMSAMAVARRTSIGVPLHDSTSQPQPPALPVDGEGRSGNRRSPRVHHVLTSGPMYRPGVFQPSTSTLSSYDVVRKILDKAECERSASDYNFLADVTKSSTLFSSAPGVVVRALCDRLRIAMFPAHRRVFIQGDAGDTMYFILDGSLNVYIDDMPEGVSRAMHAPEKYSSLPTEGGKGGAATAAPAAEPLSPMADAPRGTGGRGRGRELLYNTHASGGVSFLDPFTEARMKALDALGTMIGTLYCGECFGEQAITAPGSRRPMSLVVDADAACLVLAQKDYEEVMAQTKSETSLEMFDFLSRVSIFKGVDRDELQRLAALVVRHKFHSGRVVVWEGDELEGMFILKRGKATVVHGLENRTTHSGRSTKRKSSVVGVRRSPRPPQWMPAQRRRVRPASAAETVDAVQRARRASVERVERFRRASQQGLFGVSPSGSAPPELQLGVTTGVARATCRGPQPPAWASRFKSIRLKPPSVPRSPRPYSATRGGVTEVSTYPSRPATAPLRRVSQSDAAQGAVSLGELLPLDYFGEGSLLSTRGVPCGPDGHEMDLEDREAAPVSVVCSTSSELVFVSVSALYSALSFKSRQCMRHNAVSSTATAAIVTVSAMRDWEGRKLSMLHHMLPPTVFE